MTRIKIHMTEEDGTLLDSFIVFPMEGSNLGTTVGSLATVIRDYIEHKFETEDSHA